MRIKRTTLRMFGILFIAAAFFSKAYAVEDAILAVVNNEVITVKDLREYMKGVYAQLRIEGNSPANIDEIMYQYEQKGIEQLIDDRLILSAADKLGVQIRPEAIDAKVEEIKKKYDSYQEFIGAIKKEGLTISGIRKKVEDQLKGQVVVNKEVKSKVFVNPQEVTENFLAHQGDYHLDARVYLDTIFVKSVFGKEEARRKVDKALEEIRSGVDFHTVSARVTELPSVGEIAEKQLRPEFKKTIDQMSIGDVSDVIEVPNGFYIIKLLGRVDAKDAALNDVKDVIYQDIYEEKFRRAFKAWIEDLRQKAYVEIKR